jgi:PAS domain S-box-containing protein
MRRVSHSKSTPAKGPAATPMTACRGTLLVRGWMRWIIIGPVGIGALVFAGHWYGLYNAQVEIAIFATILVALGWTLLSRLRSTVHGMEEEAANSAAALEKEREFLRVVLENINDGIIACDPAGVITFSNRATREFHGLPRRSVPAERWDEHFSLFAADGVTALKRDDAPLVRALEGDPMRNTEMLIVPRYKPARRVVATSQPLCDAKGRKLGAIVVMHDITERKKAEDALRESEDRLRTLVSTAPVVLWAMNSEGTLTFSDGNALGLLGLTPGEVVGKSVFDVYADSADMCGDCIRALSGEEVSGTHEINGVVFDSRMMPLCDEHGNVTGVTAVATDVTERRRAEEALRESHNDLEARVTSRTAELSETNLRLQTEMAEREQAQGARRQIENRLQAIIDNAPAVIVVKDLLGRYLLVNREFERLAGVPREEITGKTDFDLFPLEQAEVFTGSDVEVRNARRPIQFEETMSREDGLRTSFVVKFPLCGPDGSVYAVCAIATDITEKKRAEQRLREAEERFGLLVEGVQDYGILMLDPGGRVQSWNSGAQRIHGHRADEIVGAHFSCFYPDADGSLSKTQEELKAAETQGRLETEGWRVRKDGTRFLANVVVTALRNESGKLRGFAAVTRDITERKKAEEKLLQAKQRAELANQAKSELLSRASHELRTPLNAIMGFGQLLEMDDLVPEQSGHVGQILTAGNQLLALIDQLLHISSLQPDAAEMALEPISLTEVAQEVLEQVRNEAANKRVDLNCEIDLTEPVVVADRKRLTQALSNLVSNAVKFNRLDGSVWVFCEPSAAGGRRIHVRDTGCGIAREDHEKVFAPFERLDAEKRGIAGIGLGLATSKAFVEAMGGTLEFSSVKGQGSTFTIAIPVSGKS